MVLVAAVGAILRMRTDTEATVVGVAAARAR